MFKIHEFSSMAGELSAVFLRMDDGQLEIVSEDGVWPLPEAAIRAVLSRFGAPFDDSARINEVSRLALPNGETLTHVRHLAGYDVIARDYIVLRRVDGETWCAMAATVAAALLHLGKAGAPTL
jgi:hypothetical protein